MSQMNEAPNDAFNCFNHAIIFQLFSLSLSVSLFFFVGIIISFHNLSSEFLEGWRIQLFISLLSLIVTRWHHLFRILIWFDIFGSIGELGIEGSGEVHWVNWGFCVISEYVKYSYHIAPHQYLARLTSAISAVSYSRWIMVLLTLMTQYSFLFNTNLL